MKIRSGFVSNSSSSSFIVASKNKDGFFFSIDDFRKYLIEDYGYDVEEADNTINVYNKEIKSWINDGWGVVMIDVENDCTDDFQRIIELLGGKIIVDFM